MDMKQIMPIIMDNHFIKLAVIDDYISFIWTTRYYTVGDFELCVDVNESNYQIFKQDYYIYREDDENVGIIENIKIQRNEDGNEILIVTGRFLAAILARRIIAVQTTVSGSISNCINQLINENVINPSIAARKINNFILGSYSIPTNMQMQFTGDNLLESISKLCETYNIGFKVTLNALNQFVFSLYEGIDRTYDQSINPWVIFSDKFDNLLSSEYEENYQNIATAVLVAGEGEGLDRKTAWVTNNATGLNRREIYDDSRNIQSNDGQISDAEYMKLLQEAGKEGLTSYVAAFTGNVYFENITYKEDINVGDLCVIENSRWGIHMNSRLVEVIESISETGEYFIVPTFGI
jgi:hypothetical protein